MSKSKSGRLAAATALWIVATLAQAETLQISAEGYTLQAVQQGSGPVTVVFEAGFGQGQKVWSEVMRALGDGCNCVAYDRAGLGESGSDGAPKRIEHHVRDLAAVVEAAAPNGKVVLVGHSYGGLLATEFARAYPQRVHGLVLVDPSTMGQRHAFKSLDSARVLADDQLMLSMLPPPMAADYTLLIAQLDSDAAATTRAQPQLPVALMTSTQVPDEPFVLEETGPGKAVWRQQHGALFASFSRGTHQYFASGHNIHREHPNAVAAAIRQVIADAVASESTQ